MNLTCLKSGIWQVELRIPSDVRVVLGRTRFAQSTGTRDKREASNRALAMIFMCRHTLRHEALKCAPKWRNSC